MHSKVLNIPVIVERIWMLYLSYYTKLNECCEHIFASCLTTENSFLREMTSQYFLVLAQSERMLHIYNTFDRKNDFRLLTFVLHNIEEGKSSDLIQALINTTFEAYSASNVVKEDH